MRDVAVLGVGMHPWGKFEGKSVTQLCREAVEAALKDAGVQWREIQAIVGRQLALLRRQGLGPERQRCHRGHGADRCARLQPVGGVRRGRQRLQHRLQPGRRRLVRHGARRRRREDAQGLHPDVGRRGRDRSRVPAPGLRRHAGTRVLGHAVPAPDGRPRHDRGAAREDRGEGAPGGDNTIPTRASASCSPSKTCSSHEL